jgi:predicted dehydrogenase
MPPAWFWKKETGGGHLIENGCHVIDFIRWIMGEVKSVTAVVDTLKFKESFPPYFENPNIEDIGNIILEHENGGISVVANGCIAPGGWGISMEIASEKSFISLFRNKRLTLEQNGKHCWEETYKEGWNPITFGIRKFVQYLRDDNTPIASSRDAKAVLEIALAAHKSSREGKRVHLPLL